MTRTPSAHRGAAHRLALNATSPDPTQRLACIPPAHAALRTTAHIWSITTPATDDILTTATELLTNAIQHAPPGTIHATLRPRPGTAYGSRSPTRGADCPARASAPAIGTPSAAGAC